MIDAGIVAALLRLGIGAAVSVGVVLVMYRFVSFRSRWGGHILAFTIIVRAIVGLSLFSLSFFNAPGLAGLHSGDGFWMLAPDARSYYTMAALAVTHGIGSIASSDPSPTYIRALTVWMELVGVSPATGMLLNLLVYVSLVGLLTYSYGTPQERDGAGLIATIGMFSLSPMLLVHSTQPLKDDFCMMLLAAACLALAVVIRALVLQHRARAGTAIGVVAMALMAGVRSYMVEIVWAVATATLAMGVLACVRSALWRYSRRAVLLLTALWLAYAVGAGPYYRGLMLPSLKQGTVKGAGPATAIMGARRGFVTTGGASNVVLRGWEDGRPRGRGVKYVGEAVVVGLGIMFVPMTILKEASLVTISGGRNLIWLADLDTVFLDVTIIAALVLAALRWRHSRENAAPLVFLLLVGIVTTVLMAFTVTNFGTLIRLRVMAAVPFWLLPIAASSGVPRSDVLGKAMGVREGVVDDRNARIMVSPR